MRRRTQTLVFAGLAIALLAISALISIPVGPIPFTLQTAAVFLIILLGRPTQILSAIGGYLFLGALGIPIFSGMQGGPAVLLGPTGGFLWGFLLAAIICSIIKAFLRPHDNRVQLGRDLLLIAITMASFYLCGCLQFAYVMDISFRSAFMISAAPFVVADLAKAMLAWAIARPVRTAYEEGMLSSLERKDR